MAQTATRQDLVGPSRGGRRGAPASRAALVALALPWLGCGGSSMPRDAKTTVLSVTDLDCADCGEELARALIEEPDVYKTAFDKRRVELTLVTAPRVDALALAQQKKPAKETYRLVRGAGLGRYLSWGSPPEGADVLEIAHGGEDVPDLSPHLVLGKVTIVDFYATWCEPCRQLDAHVLEMASRRKDLAYRKLDVGDWDTPLGTRYLKGVNELPYAIIYDKQGRKVEAVTGLQFEHFDEVVERAAR